MEKKKLKVAVYYRVSSDEQVEQYWIPLQRHKIKSWLKFHSDEYELAGEQYIYNESTESGVSGRLSFDKRPQGAKILADLETYSFFNKKPPFDIIVVYKLDRLARRVGVLYDALNKLEKYGVTIASATENFDLRTPFGKAIVGILGVFAELERDNFMERSAAWREEMKKAGKIQSATFWYYKDANGEPRTYTKEAEIVKEIFHKYTLEDASVSDICNYLKEKKIPIPVHSALNKPGVKDIKKKKKKLAAKSPYKWTDKTIRIILSNECYIGNYFYDKTTVDPKTKKTIKLPKEKWKKSPTGMPIIIPVPLFNKAQEKLAIKSATKKKEKTTQYLLSWLLYCDHCKHHREKYEMCTRQWKPSSGRWKEIYQCYWKRSDRNDANKKCNCLPLNRIDLDKLVLFHILQLLKNPKAIKTILQQWVLFNNTKEALEKENKLLIEESLKLEKKLNTLERSFYTDTDITLTEEKYLEFSDKLLTQRDAIKEKVERNYKLMEKSINTESYLQVLNVIHNRVLKEGKGIFNDIESLKKMLEYLVKRIVIFSKEDWDKVPWKKTNRPQATPYKIKIELKLPQEFLNMFFDWYTPPTKNNNSPPKNNIPSWNWPVASIVDNSKKNIHTKNTSSNQK